MKKEEFLSALKSKLSGLPGQDVSERIDFYSEMIDDRMEEGRTEEEAVSEIGTVDGVAAQIISDIPFSRIARERIRPKKRLNTVKTVLLAVGSPIWLSLAVATFSIILSIYAVLWSLTVSVWAVFASLVGCAVGGVISGMIFAIGGNVTTGVAVIGAAFISAGLCIFSFFGCKAATRGIIYLTKKIAFCIKKCFI